MSKPARRMAGLAAAALLLAAATLAGCGQRADPAAGAPAPAAPPAAEGSGQGQAGPAAEQEAEGWADAFAQLVAQVKSERPDHAAALAAYREKLQAMVRAVDAASGSSLDEQVVAALEAGSAGSLPADVVAQLVDKVLQAALYARIKHELGQAQEQIAAAGAARARLERAEALYRALRGTLAKREQAYGIELVPRAEAAFEQMRAAVQAGSGLDFALGAQLLDKTLMKAFYLAVGGDPHGYAFKARASADRGEAAAARKEQAEAWGFYQALYGYLRRHDGASADAILKALDLQATQPGAIDPVLVNRLFVRAFLATALDEFQESEERWGQDEAVITAYEGALFVDLVGLDLGRLLGGEAYRQLQADAEAAFRAARAGERATFDAKLAAVRQVLERTQAELGLK